KKMPTFNSPKSIIFGEDALDLIDTIPGNKCLIITDKNLVQLGIVEILTKKLEESDKAWKIFDQVEPDPHESTVLKATEFCNDYNPDLIIGLGGGSSLDAAKAVWFLYEHKEDGYSIDDLNPFQEVHMGLKAKYLAIPTTSGTGAEATWAAIITRVDEDGNYLKLEQSHADVIPTYAIIDPIFTKSLPQKLTVATGFDVIAHSCEGLISEWRNDMADACCLHALELVKEFFPRVFKDGNDMEAREKMANAATLAGLGFGNSQVVMGHAMGHALGAVFHLTHGITVGLMLPYVLEYSIGNPDDDTATKILGKAARKLGIAKWTENDKESAQNLIDYIKNLQKELNFPTTLEACGVTKEQLNSNMKRIVELTNESASIAMSPREPADEDIQRVIEYVFEGKSIDF
ncbi:MAG: iron-containing alcohol dehydrogenase, partial [Promethearchaeota archaeon]